jgi:threonine/homoserine/homoserine lactone efflux protein
VETELGAIGAFLLAVLAMELTPGPNMGYLAVVAIHRGRSAGYAAVAGVTLGLFIYLLCAVAGLTEIALRWPALLPTLRWIGVVYLLWLAWEAWSEREAAADHVQGDGLRSLFVRGLTANLLNPKAALLYFSILPGFVPAGSNASRYAVLLGGLHLAVSIAVHVAIVQSAAQLGTWLERRSQARRVLGRVMALLLVAVAVWLAIEQTPYAAPDAV